ncbi:TldD/PmbA family protein [Sphingomonas lutea]|uniref:TldD/PmbA family protein n=1 Tax=Sphingomonas lutea TaxID=1045317 RepID=A0A7G9SJQ0_9SPHN|nr:TldD/PmbA family protein [Sphingomonas lutea]QNN68075.1 TldD/PmbA family protein [Sphingomonas lutea]
MLSPQQARDIASNLVERGIAAGATAADALYIGHGSNSVQVRLGELEGVGGSEGEEIGLRLFDGQRSATVASSDLSEEVLATLVDRCLAMAREAPEDPFVGLAPSDLLHRGDLPALDAEDASAPTPDELRARALACEAAALAVPGVTNSSGGGASASSAIVALATSDGFAAAYRSTGHGCSAGVIAGEGAGMQRDHAWHSARHLADLDDPGAIGSRAGERAVARLDPTRPRPGKYPVLFDPRVAPSLLGHFAGAISGSAVARKTSFLLDKLGEQVFAPGVEIIDDPLRVRGLRSRPFDGEGVAVHRQALIEDGKLTGWMAESASARQLGIPPTGHAARGASGAPGASPSNFYMAAGPRSREELLAAFPEAVLIVELIGQGVNPVTGDYSRGAAGFMVRNGEIAEPVAEITIAANLLDMFATLEPASDLEFRRGMDAPTIMVPEMTVGAA